MEEVVYLSVRLGCTAYLLYKVWGWKKTVRGICDLLYVKEPSAEAEKGKPEPVDESGVIGSTRFVYLDEDAGKTIAPYMSQPLDMDTDYIGEEEDIPEEEVECKLPLEEMKMLKEEQEELNLVSPEVDSVSQAVTPDDLNNAGDVLLGLNDADKDEGKSRRAALTLHAIRETDLFEVFSSQVENKSIIDNLIGKYLDGDGNPLPVKEKKREQPPYDWKNLL